MFKYWSYWLMMPVFILLTPFTWPWIKSKNREIDFINDDELRFWQCILAIIWLVFIVVLTFDINPSIFWITPSCVYCLWIRSGIKTWTKKVNKKVISYNVKIKKQQGQLSESDIS